MKPIKRLYLSNDEIHLADSNLVLEQSHCDRGFITAETTKDYTGKLVRLDVGYSDMLLRWFMGSVERTQPAENGYQRLFVRELVGVYERAWPCSFQHPTLSSLAGWMKEQSGITVSVPDAEHADKPIPHFTHSGSGFQLLNSLGRAFGINDYGISCRTAAFMLGARKKSLFTDKPVRIPTEFSQGAAGSHSMILPVIQSLRPGVEINGERLTKFT